MDMITSLDRALRHNARLPRMAWLRSLLRKPYLALLGRNGVQQSIGGAFHVRIPAQYASAYLVKMEPETCAAIASWAKANPTGVFVDIGCSKGYLSAGVLHSEPGIRVEAIDSDVFSLGIAKRMCSFAPSVANRLRFHLGLLMDLSEQTPQEVAAATVAGLARPDVKGDPRQFQYVNLDSDLPTELPRITLDDLLLHRLSGPVMLKCDVEGGEMSVLAGAAKIIAAFRPTIMLSVHPTFLPKFGHSVDDVRQLLTDYGYGYRQIAEDHEVHWVCEPTEKQSS